MNSEGFKRKLTAILSADVKGYSRLMGDNEAETVRTLTAYREAITNLIQDYHGRVVDSPGDNILAEFISVVQAVECAVEIQKNLKALNAELPDKRRMEFRIGINLGDVIEEGKRIYGDGVNIAARIEGLSEVGGICISGSVYDQVMNKLNLGYEFLGEHTVKNIANPIRVYKIPIQFECGTDSEDITSERLVDLSIPNKPSIAILPFTNMSGDPEQEYFSDGMTEEIITRLSMNPMLTVIARNSTFLYKGKPVKIQQVGQELKVRYIIEGSVRKAGNMVRITAQLIDATTEDHLWAKTYDRDIKDIFAVQDDIAQQIAGSIGGGPWWGGILKAEQSRTKRIQSENMTAYDYWLRGLNHTLKYTQEDNAKAQEMFEKAIELDTEYSLAYLGLGAKYHIEYSFWGGNLQALDRSFELFKKAISLDDNAISAHALLASVYKFKGQYELALAETEKAISLNPNDAVAYFVICSINNFQGMHEKALEAIKKAMKLNPLYDHSYLTELSWAYRGLGKYEKAIAACNKALTQNPNYPAIFFELAVNYIAQWTTQLETDPKVLDKALEISKQKLDLVEYSLQIPFAMGWTYLLKKEYDQAILEAEKIIAINPERPLGNYLLANILNYLGKSEEAIEFAGKIGKGTPAFILPLIHAYRLTDQYEKALAIAEQLSKSNLDFLNSYRLHILLAILYSELDREEDGRSEVVKILRLVPNFSVEKYGQRLPYKDPVIVKREMAALRKVGLT